MINCWQDVTVMVVIGVCEFALIAVLGYSLL